MCPFLKSCCNKQGKDKRLCTNRGIWIRSGHCRVLTETLDSVSALLEKGEEPGGTKWGFLEFFRTKWVGCRVRHRSPKRENLLCRVVWVIRDRVSSWTNGKLAFFLLPHAVWYLHRNISGCLLWLRYGQRELASGFSYLLQRIYFHTKCNLLWLH